MSCPVPIDQLELLRLLSADARQVFTLHNSDSEMEFFGAEGEAFTSEQITRDKVSPTDKATDAVFTRKRGHNLCSIQRPKLSIIF